MPAEILVDVARRVGGPQFPRKGWLRPVRRTAPGPPPPACGGPATPKEKLFRRLRALPGRATWAAPGRCSSPSGGWSGKPAPRARARSPGPSRWWTWTWWSSSAGPAWEGAGCFAAGPGALLRRWSPAPAAPLGPAGAGRLRRPGQRHPAPVRAVREDAGATRARWGVLVAVGTSGAPRGPSAPPQRLAEPLHRAEVPGA